MAHCWHTVYTDMVGIHNTVDKMPSGKNYKGKFCHMYLHQVYLYVSRVCAVLYITLKCGITNTCWVCAGHSALTQQNEHGWRSAVPVHNIPTIPPGKPCQQHANFMSMGKLYIVSDKNSKNPDR